MNLGPIELIFVLVVGLFLISTVIAVVDLVQRPPEQFPRWSKAGKSDKTGWIVALIVGWMIGMGWVVAIVYFFLVRRKMGPVVKGATGSPPAMPPGPTPE
jgi:hypothetical protein